MTCAYQTWVMEIRWFANNSDETKPQVMTCQTREFKRHTCCHKGSRLSMRPYQRTQTLPRYRRGLPRRLRYPNPCQRKQFWKPVKNRWITSMYQTIEDRLLFWQPTHVQRTYQRSRVMLKENVTFQAAESIITLAIKLPIHEDLLLLFLPLLFNSYRF
jgi:hypothetical protein